MKLSLALSALLVGGSLFMSGCGSDSSSNDTKTQSSSDAGNSSSAAAVEAPKFTTEMLAGKTFYSYGLDEHNNQVETENRFKAIVSTDGTTMEVWSNDGSEKYGTANSSIITDAKGRSAIKWSFEGMTDKEFPLLKVFSDGSFMTLYVDPEDFSPYPQLFAATEMEDKGLALYNEFFAEQTISKEIVTANPWYSLDWRDVERNNGKFSGNFECHSLKTYNEDNTITFQWLDDNGVAGSMTIGSYIVSDNVLEAEEPQDEQGTLGHSTMTPLYVSSDEIKWTDRTAWFKNRADAIAFMATTGLDDCSKYFPEQ